MKLNIEIDLNDFYAENFDWDSDLGASPSSSLSEEVVDVIKGEVKKAISTQVKDVVSIAATKYFEEQANSKIDAVVEHQIDAFIANGKVRKNSHSDDLVSVEERMREVFNDNSSWRNPKRQMEQIGKKFAEECRNRYDLAFASNIVKGLDKQGLLKAGVIEAITAQGDS